MSNTRMKTSLTLSKSTRALLGKMGPNMSRTLDDVFLIIAELMKEISIAEAHLRELAEWLLIDGNIIEWASFSADLDESIKRHLEDASPSQLMILKMRCNIINQGTKV